MRARLPWPAGVTAPLAPAVERLVTGIARRRAHVYAQPWLRALAWLPRAALPAAIGRFGPREIARLDTRLRATERQRLRPLGPGGLAAAGPATGPAAVSRETAVRKEQVVPAQPPGTGHAGG
jgi:hypothetical protein